MGKLYPELDATEVRAEFLDEVLQTRANDTVEADEEEDQEDALDDEASSQEALTIEALANETSILQPPPTQCRFWSL